MSFSPRLTEPAWTEPYWIKTTYGGYNRCIVIDSSTGLVVPNCTGWTWGRFCEAGGTTNCSLSVGDAVDFWTDTSDGYSRSSEPSLGAVICFSGGYENRGHVAIVEQIAANGSYIVCSESDYGGDKFTLRTRYRNENWLITPTSLSFLGFIRNPNVSPSSGGQLKLWMTKAILRRRKQNEYKRTIHV